MSAPPLTHHEIIRIASPLSARGFHIDMKRSDRTHRYIEFQSQPARVPATRCIHAIYVGTDKKHHLSRVLIHDSGPVATLVSLVSDLNTALDTFELIPHERQMQKLQSQVIAFSYSLDPLPGRMEAVAQTRLQFACAKVAGIEVRVDVSTGGAMPADVRVIINEQQARYLPESLASGQDLPLQHRANRRTNVEARQASLTDAEPTARPAESAGICPEVTHLPEDFLAVLGAQWRPLRHQGDHWKGVLRTLGSEPSRTPRAEKHITTAVEHIHQCLHDSPARYHERLHAARWRVFVRRMQPLMLFLGILAMMPLSWLLVSRGDMAMHPLALGLTPLLMVGVVVMTSREIPVMEIPAKPAPLPDHYWSSTHDDYS